MALLVLLMILTDFLTPLPSNLSPTLTLSMVFTFFRNPLTSTDYDIIFTRVHIGTESLRDIVDSALISENIRQTSYMTVAY